MRINPVTALIAIGISALIAYGFYSYGTDNQKLLLGTGSFIMLATGLVFVWGIKYNGYAGTVNIRSLSVAFFIAAFVSNLIFSFVPFQQQAYIIVNGIILLLYFLCLYYLVRNLPKQL